MINSPEIDKDEIAISKEVGLRLVQARKLSDQYRFTQLKAAELLGISVGDLRLMEEGLMLVPLKVIKRAAEAFAVSADWIVGLVADDWELDQETRRERDFLVALEKLHLESRAQQVAKQVEQDNKLAALSEAVTLLSQAVQAIDDSFMAFWAKSEEFADMPGGSSVLARIDQAQAAARAATLSLVRAKALPIDALAALSQPKPPLRVWRNPSTGQLPQPVLPIAESNPRAARQRNHTSLTQTALAS